MIIEKQRSTTLESFFEPFRNNIIGYNQSFWTPYGQQNIIYADWTASGRLYRPIESILANNIAPFVGNTHTETTLTGTMMTLAYKEAHHIIKNHVNASEKDIIITEGSGMTSVVNKFQRILGLRVFEKYKKFVRLSEEETPVVFVSHMEHLSNHTSWLETIAEVECIIPDDRGQIDLMHVRDLLEKYKNRKTKIASITACSNVTGITTCYHEVAKLMHEYGGFCFVDFACSAPYVSIDMNPPDPKANLDAIYFSPHKFLGGPGSSGVLIFNSKLYSNEVPDISGGGTVTWTNPWGGHRYIDDIETREDGGTPAFLQTIKVALVIKLKEEMNVEKMAMREEEIVENIFRGLLSIPSLHILAENYNERLAIFSFYIDGLHHDLATKMLNDHFGIQSRGGCSCAGTYGHYLLNISQDQSKQITDQIDQGHFGAKPGWNRISIHPVMTDYEINLILYGIKQVASHFEEWKNDYQYNAKTNTFFHKSDSFDELKCVKSWFDYR